MTSKKDPCATDEVSSFIYLFSSFIPLDESSGETDVFSTLTFARVINTNSEIPESGDATGEITSSEQV